MESDLKYKFMSRAMDAVEQVLREQGRDNITSAKLDQVENTGGGYKLSVYFKYTNG